MISSDQIALYWAKKYRPDIRGKADKIADDLQIHSQEKPPTRILERFRPNESPEHKKYRAEVWEAITFGWFNKVVQQFAKIRRAEDWRIEWPATVANNPVQAYTQGNFAEFDTVENWFFKYHLQRVIDDPNGVCIVLPSNIEEILLGAPLDPTQPYKPTVFYYPSQEVADFTESLLVVNGSEPDRLDDGTLNPDRNRPVQYLFDKDQVVKLVQTSAGNNPTYARYEFTHRLGFTAVLNGGVIAMTDQNDRRARRKLFKSFIAPALPFWNGAISLESDHQVNTALHLHPDKWKVAAVPCTHKVMGQQCSEGKIKIRQGSKVLESTCPVCLGGGKVAPETPFGVTWVDMQRTGMSKADGSFGPIPPGGYFDRPIESIEIVKKLSDAKVFDGLAALGLEFIGTVLNDQSGKAKEFDYQEIDTFVADVAAHSVDNIISPIYLFVSAWLLPYQSEDARKKLLPSINKPRKFDLVTSEVWLTRLAALKKDGTAGAVGEAEIKLAERTYGPESAAFKQIRATVILDPLYGMSTEQKDIVLMAGGCTREDLIVSSKINFFVTRARVETKGGFFDMDFMEQVTLLLKYAKEQTAASTLAGALGGAQEDPANPAPDAAASDPRATLRGSVGGSGIIRQLRVDVAQGLATMDAAVAQIVEQLGYDETTARKMLGNPLDLKPAIRSGEATPAAATA
jgi:hypothetical protein